MVNGAFKRKPSLSSERTERVKVGMGNNVLGGHHGSVPLTAPHTMALQHAHIHTSGKMRRTIDVDFNGS